MKKQLVAILSGLCLALSVSHALGSTSAYFYDNNGRLVRTSIEQSGIGTVYSYDEVGNLASSNNAVVENSQPIIASVAPTFLIANCFNRVVITGNNLFMVGKITSSRSSFVSIRSITDSEIVLDVSPNSAGDEVLSLITTGSGVMTANMTLPVTSVVVSPSSIDLLPGVTSPVAVSLFPAIAGAAFVRLTPADPSLIGGAPPSVTIPPNSAVAINLVGQAVGSTDIVFGERVYGKSCVGGAFVRASVSSSAHSSLPVSISFSPEPIGSVVVNTFSPAVGVGFKQLPTGRFSPFSIPVSVAVSTPVFSGSSAKYASPVSIGISGPPFIGSSSKISNVVSVGISTAAFAGTSVSVSAPVSISVSTTP